MIWRNFLFTVLYFAGTRLLIACKLLKKKKPCHKEPMFFCAVTQEAKILKCDTSRPWEMVTRIENVWVEWKMKLSVKNIVKLLVYWKSKALSPSVSSAERSWWYHGRKQTEEALGTQTSLLSKTLKECWGSFMWKCLIRLMRAISIPVKRRFEKVHLKAIWLSLWCGLGTKCVENHWRRCHQNDHQNDQPAWKMFYLDPWIGDGSKFRALKQSKMANVARKFSRGNTHAHTNKCLSPIKPIQWLSA